MDIKSCPVNALCFDKDGTLFDFHATWSVWAGQALHDLAKGNQERLNDLANAVRYDLATRSFHADSIAIAGTNREIAEALLRHLPEWDAPRLERHLAQSAAQAPLAPSVPLPVLLAELRSAGLKLGVMTNDSEVGALAHLQAAQVLEAFDFVAGADSGFGAKPSPSPLLAFADSVGVSPARVAMVGDSTHDLMAGRAAGMKTIGVLTGVAGARELAPLADVVLPDIGHLPRWLGL